MAANDCVVSIAPDDKITIVTRTAVLVCKVLLVRGRRTLGEDERTNGTIELETRTIKEIEVAVPELTP